MRYSTSYKFSVTCHSQVIHVWQGKSHGLLTDSLVSAGFFYYTPTSRCLLTCLSLGCSLVLKLCGLFYWICNRPDKTYSIGESSRRFSAFPSRVLKLADWPNNWRLALLIGHHCWLPVPQVDSCYNMFLLSIKIFVYFDVSSHS